MKRRRSLLFGLGVLVSLSMAVPAYAADTTAAQDPAQVKESVQDIPDGEQKGETPVDKETTYIIEKDSEGKLQIKDQDGNLVTKNGFYPVGDQYYYVDQTGSVLTDTWAPEKKDECWVYLDQDGKAMTVLPAEKTQWQKIQGTWYYINEKGSVDSKMSGWQKTQDGMWLYSTSGVGTVKTGWQEVAPLTWMYLNEKGMADTTKTGEQHIGDKVYYLNEKGVAQTGTFKGADGKEYVFDASKGTATPKIVNGWNQIDGKWFWYENGTMKTGWLKDKNTWYYLNPDNGVMATGWYQVAGTWYYSDKNGAMQIGWVKDGSAWYYMESSGAMRTGWFKSGNTWYYLTESGAMATGWQKVGNTWYYMNNDGAMQTGWVKVGSTWYYMENSGAMKTGWLKIGGTWYYLQPSGAMATGWYVANGAWYYSNASGAMQTGWVKVGSTWYYMQSGGAMKTGWMRQSGKWYYLKSSGAMATGWTRIGSYKYYFNGSGNMVQDLDSVIGRQSSYYITVNRRTCQVMVYAKSETGKYDIPVKTFACSVGLPSTPTPTGTYQTPAKYRWHTLMGPSYGQYCTRIVGGVLFHSVAGSNMTSHNISAGNYNMLGQPASHGCVRLCVRDAKWIYDNCALGTTVTISDSAAAPFDKPATIKIPAGQNWDPTDPNA